MVEANFKDARRHGIFMRESRCPCPVEKLVATKFSKVKCKYVDESSRHCCYFMLAFFIIACLGLTALFTILFFNSTTNRQYLFLLPLCLLSIPIVVILSVLCCYNSCYERKHTALEVLYKCDSCGHEVHKCYECFVYSFTLTDNRAYHQLIRGRTYNPWGRYTGNVTKTVLHKPMTMTKFEAVEQKFDLMSGVQKDNFKTSWAWTNDLIRRLE